MTEHVDVDKADLCGECARHGVLAPHARQRRVQVGVEAPEPRLTQAPQYPQLAPVTATTHKQSAVRFWLVWKRRNPASARRRSMRSLRL